jgi:predicted Zn finger-like uncharacterized protein
MLQTTCPNCNAQFKVQPEQLNIRQGRVMCGRCRHVFNAFQFLERVTESIPVAKPSASIEPMAAVVPETSAKIPPLSSLESFEFDISEPLTTVAQADVLSAEQRANADAFEESLNSIIDGQTGGKNAGSTSYALGQTTTFSEPKALPQPPPQNAHEPIMPPLATVPSAIVPVVSDATLDAQVAAALKNYSSSVLPKAPLAPTAAAPVPVAPPLDATPAAASANAKAEPVSNQTSAALPIDMRFPHNVNAKAPTHEAVDVPSQAAEQQVNEAQQINIGSSTNPFLVAPAGTENKPKARIWVTVLYALGCLGLQTVLAAQCAFHFRDALVAQFPAHRGLALQVCEKLNCVLPWSRNLDVVKIEASDLLEIPGKPGQLVLSATLANRSTVMQDYPLFEVSLTDNTNRTVSSRVFTPQQYLARALKPDEGFAPNAEIALTLNLDAGAKSLASGYNMQLVYQ